MKADVKLDEFYFPTGQVIRWFTDSPDAGDADCLCSLCGKLIGEEDTPIRVWKIDAHAVAADTAVSKDLEARFHFDCFPKVDRKHFEDCRPFDETPIDDE